MKKLKVLVLFNSAGTPPEDQDFSEWLEDKEDDDWDAERDVITGLKRLGHKVSLLGIYDHIHLLIDAVKNKNPDVVFNLTENFLGNAALDGNIVGLLEMLGVPFTGCGLAGMVVCRNKGVSKEILKFHRIKVPQFAVFQRQKRIWRPKDLGFPIMVKPLREDASLGISQNSLVENDEQFCERVRFIHESMKMDAIAEEYIEGRELYVSILENGKLKVLPIREMKFTKFPEESPRVATYKAKWDYDYRHKWGINNVFAGRLPDGVPRQVEQICKKAYRALELRGYARFDMRLREDRELFVIEANPNPWLAKYDEVGLSAEKAEIPYERLLQSILDHALKHRKKRV